MTDRPSARPDRVRHLYLEVIPEKTAAEAGGFGKAATRRRGVAVAATFDALSGFRMFRGDGCTGLVAHLQRAEQVVGYNCVGFDYELIHGRIPFKRPETIDLMQVASQGLAGPLSLMQAVREALGDIPVPSVDAIGEAVAGRQWREVGIQLRERLRLFARLHAHHFPGTPMAG